MHLILANLHFSLQDSEDDEYEETEEEFLNRYAEAALALENGTVIEEGDLEDEDQEMDFEQGPCFVIAVQFAIITIAYELITVSCLLSRCICLLKF